MSLLRCQASGDPEPTVTWRKNGASLLGKDPRFSLLEHGSLQIQNTRVGWHVAPVALCTIKIAY